MIVSLESKGPDDPLRMRRRIAHILRMLEGAFSLDAAQIMYILAIFLDKEFFFAFF